VSHPRSTTKTGRVRALVTDSDTDSEHSWDFGVGDLVIDLDADIERDCDGVGNYDTTMSSSDALKMKIKRKNSASIKIEASEHKPEPKADQNSPDKSHAVHGKSSDKSFNKVVNTPEKSPSTKGRGSGKKTSKVTNRPSNPNSNTTAVITTSPTGTVPTDCSVASPTQVGPVTGSSPVNGSDNRLGRQVVTPAKHPPRDPAHDPYEFNAKFEDRLMFPAKKPKVDKVYMFTYNAYINVLSTYIYIYG